MTYPDKPIVLMGFMGSGKSTLGKALARKFKLRFTDLDRYIERETGWPVQKIFSDQGEGAFRELEKKCLAVLLEERRGVIAIGGGAPCNEENIRMIKEKSLSVYVKITIGELVRRLSASPVPRPLLAGRDQDEVEPFIASLLKTREKYYSQADIILESDCLTAEALERAILPSF